jgi:hypothetical protein
LRINPLMVSPSNHWNGIRFGEHQDHEVREGEKKGTRKILTGTSVPLDTCLMGDPPESRVYSIDTN